MNLFWQQYTPSPILWQWGQFTIHWYGLIMVVAIVAAAWYAYHFLQQRLTIQKKQIEDLLFYIIIFGLLGARFGHVVFFEWGYYSQNLGDIVKVWQGGLSIQGALFFAIVALVIWTKKHKLNFWRVADTLVPAVALGQFIGRWGNYFNQELYGQPTTGWWGIKIDYLLRQAAYQSYELFHPTFFYESILNLLLFIGLHKLLQVMRIANPGLVTLLYFGLYSVIRFIMEFIRIDETVVISGFRLPQLISTLVIIAVILLVYKMYLKPLPKLEK